MSQDFLRLPAVLVVLGLLQDQAVLSLQQYHLYQLVHYFPLFQVNLVVLDFHYCQGLLEDQQVPEVLLDLADLVFQANPHHLEDQDLQPVQEYQGSLTIQELLWHHWSLGFRSLHEVLECLGILPLRSDQMDQLVPWVLVIQENQVHRLFQVSQHSHQDLVHHSDPEVLELLVVLSVPELQESHSIQPVPEHLEVPGLQVFPYLQLVQADPLDQVPREIQADRMSLADL